MAVARHRSTWAALVAAFALLAVVPSVAGAQTARIVVRDSAERVADPGSVVSVAFVVTWDGREPAQPEPRAVLPAGWRAITALDAQPGAPGATGIRIVSVVVPADAAPGRYRIALAPPSGAGSGAGVVVRVRERRRLATVARDAPGPIAAGERFALSFVVSNLGNAASLVRARVTGGDGLRLAVDSTPMAIAAGGSRVVLVAGATDGARLRAGGARPVQLLVKADHAATDTAAWASAAVTVTVLPALADGGDVLARVPTALTLRGGRGQLGRLASAPGVEWSGTGALGDGSDRRIDFLARWSAAGALPFGEQNAYRLRLTSRDAELLVGDQLYGLSPLTTPIRYASGVGGRVDRGPWSVRAFADHVRAPTLEGSERAASAGVHRGDSEFALNFLTADGPTGGRALSARGRLDASARAHVDAEYGTRLGATPAQGWRVAIAGASPLVSYDVRAARADSAFPGRVGGTREGFGYLALRPSPTIRVSAQHDARSTVAGAAFGGGARSAVASALRLAIGDRFAARYRAESRDGDVLGQVQHARDRAIEVRLDAVLAGARVSASAERGVFEDRGAGTTSPFHRAQLEVSGPLPWGSALSGSVTRNVGQSLYAWTGGSTTSVGVAADIAQGMATHGRLSAAVDVASGPWAGHTGRLEAEAVHDLPHGHELAVRVRLPSNSEGLAAARAPMAQIDYRIPLAAPVGRKRDVGRFSARVTDGESGRGLPGVVLRVGRTMLVTDGDGRAGAVALPSGAHALRIEARGSRIDLVPVAAPSVVTVLGGRTSHLDLTLVRSVRVVGRVRRHALVGSLLDARRDGATADSGGVQQLIVTLTQGSEASSRATDAAGAFAFDGLRPGRWHLAVSGVVPAGYELERAALDLELAAGGTQDVPLRVLPTRRRVQITTEAELRAEPPPVPAATACAACPVRGQCPDSAHGRPNEAAPRGAPPAQTPDGARKCPLPGQRGGRTRSEPHQ